MSIAALIEAVEAGTANMRDFIDAFGRIPMGNDIEAYNAYNGSLDAAMALHEALLPGVNMDMSIRDGAGSVWVLDDKFKPFLGSWHNPARAWLLAILRAKEAGQ